MAGRFDDRGRAAGSETGNVAGALRFGPQAQSGFSPTPDSVGAPAGFDPIWGTLGAPTDSGGSGWRHELDREDQGVAVDVEIFGEGFRVAGQVRTGQFDRLSDWINMQTGFIRVLDASQIHAGDALANRRQPAGELWVRLGQIVLVAARTVAQLDRPGAPVVQKQWQRVSILTPGHSLEGNIHLLSDGSMKHFLETPDPHWIPLTDVTVRGLSRASAATRFPFAMVAREQLITVRPIVADVSAPAREETEVRSA